MYLIKNAKVYAPEELGIQDVLIGGGKILKIAKDLPEVDAYDVKVIDGTGKVMFPGLIDAHVHILGGGGEGGAGDGLIGCQATSNVREFRRPKNCGLSC
jgi:beta-aspartyl-dipeptidase (metallo-type)